MKSTIKILIVITIMIIMLTGCTNHNESSYIQNQDKIEMSNIDQTTYDQSYFIEPNEIIIYKNGDKQIFTKENPLFDDIVKLMNDRENKYIGLIRTAFTDDENETIKTDELVIEFVYLETNKLILEMDSTEREYTSLIFPLTGEYMQLCIVYNDSNNLHGTIGRFKNCNSLYDLVNSVAF